jgi:hypothetical protein
MLLLLLELGSWNLEAVVPTGQCSARASSLVLFIAGSTTSTATSV